jgi:hypothetical protein
LFSTRDFLQGRHQIDFKEAYVRVVIISNTYSHSFSSYGLKSLWVIHIYSILAYVARLKLNRIERTAVHKILRFVLYNVLFFRLCDEGLCETADRD